MKTANNRALFGILFLIFAFFVILMIFAAYTMNILKSESSTGLGLGRAQSVAVVEVDGPIMEEKAKEVIPLLIRAEKDRKTKAIIVRINSPGGAVGPAQEIYEEIRRIDDLYNETGGKEGRPVYASFGAISTSAGYYIGAAARKIYSNAGTLTGSIGVILSLVDMSKLYEWARLKPIILKAGKYKDVGGGHRGLTQEEKRLYSERLELIRLQFVDDILRVRKKRIKGDMEEIAQGQLFSGQEALKLGLVDELAGLQTAGRRIHQELGLSGEFGLKFIRKKEKVGLWRVLNRLDESLSKLNELKGYFSQGILAI